MLFERNESKISNLLQSYDNLPENDFEGQKRLFFDVIRELERVIEEQEKAFQKLRKQFENHEVLTPEFRRKEAEFQKETRE